MSEAERRPPDKGALLHAYGFPPEWLTWDLYPDELFAGHIEATRDDTEPHPDEHLRYGAFLWWLRRHRELGEETLIRLCRLAALDPDPPMAGAALHDILSHPGATEHVAEIAAALAFEHEGWHAWFKAPDVRERFQGFLDEGRLRWRERLAAHRVALDLREPRLSEAELRELFAAGHMLVLRGLVEHPNLPLDLPQQLTEPRTGRSARVIRSFASQRVAGRKVAPTDFRDRYGTDPWSWPR